jgi:hypothetical protein
MYVTWKYFHQKSIVNNSEVDASYCRIIIIIIIIVIIIIIKWI